MPFQGERFVGVGTFHRRRRWLRANSNPRHLLARRHRRPRNVGSSPILKNTFARDAISQLLTRVPPSYIAPCPPGMSRYDSGDVFPGFVRNPPRFRSCRQAVSRSLTRVAGSHQRDVRTGDCRAIRFAPDPATHANSRRRRVRTDDDSPSCCWRQRKPCLTTRLTFHQASLPGCGESRGPR